MIESQQQGTARDLRPVDEHQRLDELLTVDDVAALLRVNRSWVYEHSRQRHPRSTRLPHIKLGKYVRFDPRAVRTFLAQRCQTT
jgi:excisionase family DNA binding protein